VRGEYVAIWVPKRGLFEMAYLGHDRLTVFALDIAERHLRALILVDF
jgi:hypothetical protein